MNLEIETLGPTSIVHVKETALTYPMLGDFYAKVSQLFDSGARTLIFDLTEVGYLDSASLGCLMDIFHRASQRNSTVKLFGLQARVEALLRMVGLTCRFGVLRSEEQESFDSPSEPAVPPPWTANSLAQALWLMF